MDVNPEVGERLDRAHAVDFPDPVVDDRREFVHRGADDLGEEVEGTGGRDEVDDVVDGGEGVDNAV